MHSVLPDSRTTWIAYYAVMSVVALYFFSDLSGLPLDTHDADYFQDSADALTEPATFFSPDKRMPGRPGLELILLLQYIAWGEDAAAYHLFSGLLHLIAALVLSRTGRAMGLDLIPAMLAGLLFLGNVSHFNAVHWISAQCYPLVLICGGLALISYSCNRPFLVYALLLLGVLCHISAAAFWLLLLYLAWRQGDRMTLRRYLPLGLLLGPALLAIKLGYPRAPQAIAVASSFDPAGALGNMLVNWSRLFSTAHWLPHNLYDYQTWELFLGAFGFLAFVVSQCYYRFPLGLWQAWIFVHLLPQLLMSPAYIWTIASSGPSRYLYLAAAGSSILLALGLDWIRRRIHVYAAAALLLSILASSYHSLNQVQAMTFYTAGRHYIASQDLNTGGALLQRAIDHAPEIIDMSNTLQRLGMIHLRNPQHFTDFIGSALEIYPDDTTLNLFSVVYNTIDVKERRMHETQLQSLCTYDPTYAKDIGMCYYNLGLGLFDAGRIDQAIYAYQRSLEFLPDRVKVMKDLVNALVKQGDIVQQAQLTNLLTQIATLSPNDPEAQYKAMLTLRLQRKPERALEFGRKSLALRPSTDLYLQLGNLYGQLGDAQRAVEHYRYALDREPNIAAQFSLGLALLSLGHTEQARTAYAEVIAQFGADEAERIGAVASLKVLAKSNSQAARDILQTYWP